MREKRPLSTLDEGSFHIRLESSGYRPGTSVTPETGNMGDTVAQNRRWEEEPNALERDDTHARANPLLAGLRARDL